MILENVENTPRRRAENNGCGYHRVKLISLKSAGLVALGRKTDPNVAKYLGGDWKTIRATDPRQRMIALTKNEMELRHGC